MSKNNPQDTALLDISKLSKTGKVKFRHNLLLKIIMALPAYRKIQKWHQGALSEVSVDDFKNYLHKYLELMRVNIETVGKLNIPKKGGCIFVANHPTGLLECAVWLHVILEQRPDLKMLANNWFDLMTVAKNNIIAVNNFESKGAAKSESIKQNIKGMIEAKKWLEHGGALMIFPAGEVAHWNWSNLGITDPPWKQSLLSLSKKANAPIIPCYSSSKNSLLFNIVGNIHPRLRTLMLAREFTAKQKKTIKIATNNEVESDYLNKFTTSDQKMAFVRLASEALNDKPFAEHLAENKEIIDKISSDTIYQELLYLKKNSAQNIITNTDDYCVYAITGRDMPVTMREIGRLREYNFRQIGEGSGKELDIDKYDAHYTQIFLWDKKEQRILGGTRVGFGDDPEMLGVYFLDHVKYKPEFVSILKESLDFGRLFVVDDAPPDYNVIFILMRTLANTLRDSKYNYLLGQVSIPALFPKLAIDVVINFLFKYSLYGEISPFVRGRKNYKITRKHEEYINKLTDNIKTAKDINKLLHKLFQSRLDLPGLIRFYLKCNAKLIGVNYDKDFGTVDALMAFHKKDLPKFFR